jgi:anti-sigma-K factor RskA
MSRDSDIELFSLHLLGALDGDEAARVRARFEARHSEDLEAITAAESLVGSVGAAAPLVTPPLAARERLLARVAHDAPEVRSRAGSASALPPRPAAPSAPSPRTRWIVPAVLGVAFAALALFNALRDTGPTIDSAEQQVSALLLDPSTPRWIMTDTTGPAARPIATVVGDAKQRRFFLAADRLAAPPKGKSYVLWTVSKEPGASPRNVGAIKTSSDAKVILEVLDKAYLSDLAAVAISVEADERVTAPTKDAIVGMAKAP